RYLKSGSWGKAHYVLFNACADRNAVRSVLVGQKRLTQNPVMRSSRDSCEDDAEAFTAGCVICRRYVPSSLSASCVFSRSTADTNQSVSGKAVQSLQPVA